jgi:hypothetical protein
MHRPIELPFFLCLLGSQQGLAQQTPTSSAIDERLQVECDGQYACVEQAPLSAADAARSYPYPLSPRPDQIGAIAAAPPPPVPPASSR